MIRRALALCLLVASGCANYEKRITADKEAYQADTLLQDRMLEPLAIEPRHGQITVAITRKFAEKLLVASLKPNKLLIDVAQKGRAWRGEGQKLGIHYDNGVWLNAGTLALHLAASELALESDTVRMRTVVDGAGQINADLRFFGVQLTRDVELVVHHDEPLNLKLEAAEGGWVLRAVGAPLHADVEVKMPALQIAGSDLYKLHIARTLEIPLEQLKPWVVPLPAPHVVNVGPERISIGLTHYAFGAHGGQLWLGADLLVGGAPETPATPPAPAPAPATPPAPDPHPAPAATPAS